MSWKIFHYNGDIDEGLKFGAGIAAFCIFIWRKVVVWYRTKFSNQTIQSIETGIIGLKMDIKNLVDNISLMRKENEDFRVQFRELNRVINDEREHRYNEINDIKEDITHLGENLLSIESTLELYGMNPKKRL